MLSLPLFTSLLALTSAFPTSQQPLQDPITIKDILEVRYQLHRAEIIPTVIDDFLPILLLNITWPTSRKHSKKTQTAALGNTLKPKKLQDTPNIYISDDATSSLENRKGLDGSGELMQYTLVMTDPDAPSRDDPEWSEICHWIITGIRLQPPPAQSQSKSKLKEIIPYKPPGPPPKTGKHRYVFLVLAPANSTTEELHLSKPKDRQHWGYDWERMGVRQWMMENGLVAVGANFIYAQNKKQ